MKSNSSLVSISQQVFKKINLNKKHLFTTLVWANGFFTLLAILSLVYHYGYGQAYRSMKINENVTLLCLLFYVSRFVLKFLLEPQGLVYIKRYLVESCLVSSVFLFIPLAEFYSSPIYFFQHGFVGMTSSDKIYLSIFHLLLLLFIGLELGRATTLLSHLRIAASQLLTFSFLILVFAGAGLLMLPQMTDPIARLTFTDALFTATSACCATGLNVVDVSSVFTIKGQLVIMFLIQVGGVNMIAFAAFFASMTQGYAGVRYHVLMKDFFHVDNYSDSRKIIKSIVWSSLLIEAMGSILIYHLWRNEICFSNTRHKIFYSVFHSISAFNNSGFTLFNDGFFSKAVRYNYGVQTIMIFLVFLGGLGFAVLYDVFNPNRIMQRFKFRWKKLHTRSFVSLSFSFGLLAVGALMFYLLENENTLLVHTSRWGKLVTCLFQSASTRTAGFYSVDFLAIGQPIMVFFIMLMFIGASPGSTGGGIKVTSFAILIKTIFSTISNRGVINLHKRTISPEMINQAYAIASFSIIIIWISTFILSITEKNVSFLRLLFEEVSAFCNVGLSTGITSLLSTAGKYVVIANMYVGRIGTLTLILLFAVKRDVRFRYAKSRMMVD